MTWRSREHMVSHHGRTTRPPPIPRGFSMKMLTFVATAVIAFALGAPCPGDDTPRAKRNDAASEKLGIKLSLQCYTYRALTFFETVDKAAALGVKYLEIYPGQKLKRGSNVKLTRETMTDETIADLKKKLADAGGLKLVAYGVAPVPVDEARGRQAMEWAKKMGIEVLVTETYPNEVHDKLCTEYNLKMALHNHPKTWPPDEVLKATKDRCKLIGSCSGTGHWMRAGCVPVEAFHKLNGRVLHSHSN